MAISRERRRNVRSSRLFLAGRTIDAIDFEEKRRKTEEGGIVLSDVGLGASFAPPTLSHDSTSLYGQREYPNATRSKCIVVTSLMAFSHYVPRLCSFLLCSPHLLLLPNQLY